MYAVIFRARAAKLDDDYAAVAQRLREAATSDYGCTEFCSFTRDDEECAISYWHSLEQIQTWKANMEHRAAQQKGREYWYHSYTVQVVEILRQYSGGTRV